MLIRLVFTMHINAKATPTNDTDYSCYIKAYLTNHKYGSISYHWLLIASGQMHTHTHTDVCTKAILRNQARAGQIKGIVWL